MTRYLSHEEVLILHARLIDETGGMHGVREIGQIASLAERPKMQFGGKDLYPTVFDKAATYFESCAYHHSFLDGNKRTAIILAASFLHMNGYELVAKNDVLEKFVLSAIIKKYSVKEISNWLKKNSQKSK